MYRDQINEECPGMSLITLFSAPKPFTDPHIGLIQRNAIRSWTCLPDVEVVLLGREAGLEQVAKEMGAIHIPEVEYNERGTPLISSMLEVTRKNTRSPILGIVNTDILFSSDLIEAARHISGQKDKFVFLSRRWDLEITQPMDFSPGWEEKLKVLAEHKGSLHKPAGSDFFVFPRECYDSIPPFAVGRSGWDNWMIYKARMEKWPVIDCTPSVLVVHQTHDYRHLPGGQTHHTTPETDENIRLAGGQSAIRYTILDSTHELIQGGLARPAFTRERLTRRIELIMRNLFFFLPEDQIESIARPKRWKKRLKKWFKINP